MKKSAITIFMSLMTLSGFASAQTMFDNMTKDVGFSVKGGLNGVGFDLTKPVTPYVSVRAGYSEMKINKTYDQDDVNYDGKLKVGGWDLLVDYYPWASGMKVSVGAYSPKTAFDAKAKYTGLGTVTLNNVVYSASDVGNLNAHVRWSGVKPYLGFGYDGLNNRTASGVYFSSDVGVIFSGRPSVELTANCTASSAALCNRLVNDLETQRAKFNDDVRQAKWLPVVQVAVGYRF